MAALPALQISGITSSYRECLLGWFPGNSDYDKDNAFINSSSKYVSGATSSVLVTMSDAKDTRSE